jgi:hypothetical protein
MVLFFIRGLKGFYKTNIERNERFKSVFKYCKISWYIINLFDSLYFLIPDNQYVMWYKLHIN